MVADATLARACVSLESPSKIKTRPQGSYLYLGGGGEIRTPAPDLSSLTI